MRRLLLSALALVAFLALPASAPAAKKPKLPKDVTRTTYRYPIDLQPGTNIIKIRFGVPRPQGAGYIVRFAPNLTRRNGTIPPTDKIHLHHAVWLRLGTGQDTDGYPAEILTAVGEEKTRLDVPRPYGIPVNATETWLLNDMIHDLTNRGMRLYITWTVDFVKADSELGRRLRPVHPLWNDVRRGETYPVFDVLQGSGRNGKFTYPNQDPNAYPNGYQRNQVKIKRPGTLVATGGHVHPGGLYTDMRLNRAGRSKLIFRSEAHYFRHHAPVSWDLSMTVTPKNWRVRVVPDDVLSISATYDTKHGSWYESMGIMPALIAYDDEAGADSRALDPFASKIETRGHVTHGHLAENDNFGGNKTGIADPAKLPDGSAPDGVVPIGGFKYQYGDLSGVGSLRNPPTVPVGSSLEFVNKDVSKEGVFHTVTACRAPCNRSTGVGYPLANGTPLFDSGQLGFGPAGFTAASNRDSWKTPADLPPGTYTYLCRAHPFMRGAFRVVSVS
jgi:plastocyanin